MWEKLNTLNVKYSKCRKNNNVHSKAVKADDKHMKSGPKFDLLFHQILMTSFPCRGQNSSLLLKSNFSSFKVHYFVLYFVFTLRIHIK